MKLSEINLVEASDDLESIAKKVLTAFKNHTLGRDVRSGDYDEPEKQGNAYEFGIRYWGDWEVPDDDPDAEDDDDYDWKVPTKASTKAADELCKKLEAQHGVKIKLSGGEKEWTYVTVSKG